MQHLVLIQLFTFCQSDSAHYFNQIKLVCALVCASFVSPWHCSFWAVSGTAAQQRLRRSSRPSSERTTALEGPRAMARHGTSWHVMAVNEPWLVKVIPTPLSLSTSPSANDHPTNECRLVSSNRSQYWSLYISTRRATRFVQPWSKQHNYDVTNNSNLVSTQKTL